MNKGDFINDLKDLKECFKQIDYEFWIIGGVLLGHIRDGDFLQWDDEMDIATRLPYPEIFEWQQESSIKNWLRPFEKAGFKVEVSHPKLYFGWIVRLTKRTRTDLMILEEYKGDLCYSYGQHYMYYPKMMFENMDKIKIGNKDFNIPTPAEEFLYLKYGDEWRISKAKIVEKRKTLLKSEFNELYDKKLRWRSESQCMWAGKNLRKEMIDYYNKGVYIAGCWDLFHYGHLRILERASALGYRLIVGVGTDEYILRYKKKKPVIPYEQRRRIIGSLKCVNKVVPHDEKKSIEVYDEEQIKILVIGSDYSKTESHKGRLDAAKKRDIEIQVFDITKGINTSIIKDNIKDEK